MVRRLPARTLLVPSLTIAVLAGCGAVNDRPYLDPLPNAIVDTVHAHPRVVIPEIEGLVTAEGLGVRLSTAREGYLETEWFDTETMRSGATRTREPHRVVRLRFFANPIGEDLTELLAEAVIRQTLDPSLPERENERMVPTGHPGEELLNRILTAVAERFGDSRS